MASCAKMNKAELEAEVLRLKIENNILQETIVMMGDRTQIQYIPYPVQQPDHPSYPHLPTRIWCGGVDGQRLTDSSIADYVNTGKTISLCQNLN